MIEYQNLSSKLQIINTNKGRSLHVDSKASVELEAGEENSPEIVGKIIARPPIGRLTNHVLTKPGSEKPIEKAIKLKKEDS